MLEIAGELMLCLVKLHGTVVVPFVRYLAFIVLISIFYIFISAECCALECQISCTIFVNSFLVQMELYQSGRVSFFFCVF